MADRRTVRLSQLPERLAREKLEDSDWVTFAVLVNKATQKSNNSVSAFILFCRVDKLYIYFFITKSRILECTLVFCNASCRGKPSASGS